MFSSFFHVAVYVSILLSVSYADRYSFDIKQANISVWLSAATYCDQENYLTHVFKGPTTGFVVTNVIHDILTDTQGYVGYLPSDNSIYIAFRGTEDARNWITDYDVIKTEYTSFPECNCLVHSGFYKTEQRVIGDILNYVKILKETFPSYAVKVTGHSLGAAIAQFTSMDLVKAGYDVSIYNFGQPRTGTKEYSSFVNSKLQTWRLTHNQDIVPHVPAIAVQDFYHVCTEVFEDLTGNLKVCDSTCEDPTCADQFPLKETNTADHLIYLGQQLYCDAVSH